MRGRVARGGFTLVELLACVGIVGVLGALLFVAGWKAYEDSSLAVSANNIRQLAAGSSSYLADNNYVYWRYRFVDPSKPPGVTWWFGFEPAASFGLPEGQRIFKPEEDPWATTYRLDSVRTPAFDSPANPSSQSIDSGISASVTMCCWAAAGSGRVSPFATGPSIGPVRLLSLRRLRR